MSVIEKIKAGAREAPAFYIIIYWFSRFLDNYTTYLASPDLKYEGDWFIRYFNLGWSEIIIKDLIILVFVTSGVLYAVLVITRYFISLNGNLFIHDFITKRKLIFSLIILCTFYTHMFYSLFLSVSNILQYFFLYRTGGFLYSLGVLYVDEVIMKYKNIFYYYFVFFIVFGSVYAIFYIRSLREKVLSGHRYPVCG